jgi:hypothetical protein
MITRRQALFRLGALAGTVSGCSYLPPSLLKAATFSADVTVPKGHPMMGGAWMSKTVADPLEAHGLVLTGVEPPVVFVSVDWCEIRNDAYLRWQNALADAAGTTPERVMISTVHQHDAPVADLEAEQILRDRKLEGTVCDPVFHETAVRRVATALRESLAATRPISHLGMGQAKVERIGALRRYVTPDGAVRFDRMSRSSVPEAIAAEEGAIDPWLKTLSFWNEDEPVAGLNFYAVHPMSHYGKGEVSADFPGIARRRRQKETPRALHIYVSGCSGNVVAGKYNPGTPESRVALADRLHAAMLAAWRDTKRVPSRDFTFRNVPLDLAPRNGPGFTIPELESQLAPGVKPFKQCLAAMGLSWRNRLKRGRSLSVPAIDFGPAQLILLPGESYVEYQLAAQQMRPDSFVCVAGYGDGATGYIPTEKYVAEGDPNLKDWCWVAPGSEPRMMEAIRRALAPRGKA